MEECTFAIIKPDAVQSNFIGNILALIEAHDMRIVAAKMLYVSLERAELLYAEHQNKPFYQQLVSYITSSPVMVQVIQGGNAVAKLRQLIGATNPREAAPGTIRHLYAAHNKQIHKNAVHASDSVSRAKEEISFFFDEDEIFVK